MAIFQAEGSDCRRFRGGTGFHFPQRKVICSYHRRALGVQRGKASQLTSESRWFRVQKKNQLARHILCILADGPAITMWCLSGIC